MQIRGIDELNTLSKPPKEYFGEMDLTEAQIEERIQFTEDAKEEFLLSMELMATMSDYGGIDYDRAKRQLEDRLALLIDTYITMDAYLRQYASDSAQNFVDATGRNVDKEWYFSEDRALYNAENSANDTLNYKDYVKAIEDGYTHKKWITERDPRVRPTHRELEGQIIGVMDYFVVGNALMRFPKDYELAYDAPEETVNCRCSIKYLNRAKAQDGAVAENNRYGTIKRGKMIAGTHPVTNEQIQDILSNELSEFTFPVIPTYNPRIKSQGKTIASTYAWGEVKAIKSIDIGKQVVDTRENLIDSLLHEYLESEMLLKKATDPFFENLYKAGDDAIHEYINRYIKDFFDRKGLNYGLVRHR